MDPIKIEFTPEQRAQVEPLLKSVEELNGLGVFCMTAGQVFSDGMVIGIVSGERAHELSRGSSSASASECVAKSRNGGVT